MRILHIVPTYFPAVRYGGTIYSVHGLARGLAQRGHDVHVFTTNVDGDSVSEVPLGRAVDIEGVKVRYFPASWPRRIFRTPALADGLRSAIKSFEVVHLHSVFLWPTWAAAHFAKRADVAYVLSPRGMLIPSLISRRSWLVKSAWIHLIERRNVENASAIHVTSQVEAAELETFGWRLPNRAVIPNGIDEPLIVLERPPADIQSIITAGQPLILYLGRLSWKKGLERLLYGFARCQVGHLAIVGTDDEGIAPRLAKIVGELRLENRVHILPRTVIGAEKEHLFAAARVFVLPSYSENFGNTVLEAMRRGVPVITTPDVGAAEVVRKCAGGIVAEGDPEPFGTAMARLVQNPDLARSMGEIGQRHVRGNFSWSMIAASMENLYGTL